MELPVDKATKPTKSTPPKLSTHAYTSQLDVIGVMETEGINCQTMQ